MFNFLLFGLTLGFSAGIIPGPFQAVVISQTLKHNFWEGVKVSLSVLLTDIFFVSFTFLLFFNMKPNDMVLGFLYLAGFGYLMKLAYENFSYQAVDTQTHDKEVKLDSIKKGAITLFLSPGSYLFWFTLGGPTIVEALAVGSFGLIFFLVGLYVSFIGSNIAVAFAVYKSRDFLKSTYYNYLIKFVGVSLAIYALMFLKNGVGLLI